jgi:pimeloyl-ACP methyl ester carboxylesterase
MRSDRNGVSLWVEVTGSGRPVLLLHGFPDTHEVWHHQVRALPSAGFQTICPDQRGLGRSDKPSDVAAYAMRELVQDAVGVLDTLGIERAAVVGHDWGAAVAWMLATFHPERVDRLVVLSVGHPGAFGAAGLVQREKSWYVLLFQFEGLAEQWLTQAGWANFRAFVEHPEADRVIATLEADASLTSALAWYRANQPPESLLRPPPSLPPVEVPTLGIWSTGDRFLTEVQMTGSANHVAAPWRYERLDGPGHWLQLEAPEAVSSLLVDFLHC